MSNPDTGEVLDVVPGVYRQQNVKVHRHIPVSPASLPAFMTRFESAYSRLKPTNQIIGAACTHHRLLHIHPFLDGNGRVARLVSYAMLREGLDTKGLWSVARGLARQEGQYKEHLSNCDLRRRNDLDGRGHLSEEALAAFVRFFLTTCIDQVEFMEALMQPARLRARIMLWVEEEVRVTALPRQASMVMRSLLQEGELRRSQLPVILNASDRTARRITSSLLAKGVIRSESSRAPLYLNFPAELASLWLPGLFPDKGG